MTFPVDLVTFFQLRIQICRIHLTWKIRRTVIDPAIFIYLSTEEFTSVRALFPENFRFFLIFVLLENKRTAFTHREVLRLVETVTAEIADRSQSFSMIVGIYALRSIFHNFQIVFLCNFHNLVHLTCNTGIVDRNDCPCFVSDCLFNKIFVNIHRIWSDIHKYDFCTAEHKSISRRNKGIRRHDHFVSRLDIAQKSGHFQRMCTGCRQKHLIDIKTFLHPFGTQLRVFAITAEHSLRNRILNII